MTSPFVRRRRLAAELRTLREERGLTADELAKLVYRSRMKISRLENARGRPDMALVMKLLDVLNVTGDKWHEVIAIARDATEQGWWDTIGDAMGTRQRLYADVESGANSIRGYNQMSIPGLLQTSEFVWAIINVDRADGSELSYVPELSVEARERRQEVVFRPDGPTYEIIMDEFVLRRLAVPTPVMVAQLRHMVHALTRNPRSMLRILPLDARLSPGPLPRSSFMIYTFPDTADPSMALVDTAYINFVHSVPHEVASYEHLYNRIRQATLPELESLSLLEETANRLGEQMGSDT